MVDQRLDQKIEKRRFFQDIRNSFQWVTGIGPKMPQFFFILKNLNKYGR